MKLNNIFKGLALMLAASPVLLTSCEDEPDKYEIAGGHPVVNYIRPVDYDSRDSLITQASMRQTVCLVGQNLRSITELFFNDQKAVLNTSYITDNTLIVTVPGSLPGLVSDKIFMVNSAKDTTEYDFKVVVPGPTVSSMRNEWAKAGDEAVVYGSFFINDPNVPIEVTVGGTPVQLKSLELSKFTFTVPDGLAEGTVKVKTIYGQSESKFRFRDSRGMITNFDGEGNSGTKGIVPQGWNLDVKYSDQGGVDGYYAQVGPTALTADGGWTEPLKMSFWCGNWNGDPMSITEGAGTPLRNLMPAGYFDKPEELAFKFELCVPASNPWQAGALQVVFANYQKCANDTWQNNTYIHTSASGGLDLCRGLYRPWSATTAFDTADEWITVTMPIADFKYNMDGTAGAVPVTPDSFDSFVIWPLDGGVKGADCTPILRYDNIRIVPIK